MGLLAIQGIVMELPRKSNHLAVSFLGLAVALAGFDSLAAEGAPGEPVVVIRGSSISTARLTPRSASAANGHTVVVMRPESGSFMRETTRLAHEAQAREEREAAEQARHSNRQLLETLEAIEQAAGTVTAPASVWWTPIHPGHRSSSKTAPRRRLYPVGSLNDTKS